LLIAGVSAAGAVAAVLVSTERVEISPPMAFVETWIDAWNERDAQSVSSMTCEYIPAFVPAGVIEDYVDLVAEDRPVVGDHTIGDTEAAVVHGREVVRVPVTYVREAGEPRRERNVFVRVRDTGEMCIGQPVNW
jgi:hypothetical protein